jgi:hypothetical protein
MRAPARRFGDCVRVACMRVTRWRARRTHRAGVLPRALPSEARMTRVQRSMLVRRRGPCTPGHNTNE